MQQQIPPKTAASQHKISSLGILATRTNRLSIKLQNRRIKIYVYYPENNLRLSLDQRMLKDTEATSQSSTANVPYTALLRKKIADKIST